MHAHWDRGVLSTVWFGGSTAQRFESRFSFFPRVSGLRMENNEAQLPAHFASHRRTCTDNGTTVACWQRQRASHPNQANHSPLRKRVKRGWGYSSTIAAIPQVDNHKSRASALHPRLRDCASTPPLDKSRLFTSARIAEDAFRLPCLLGALAPRRLAYPASRRAAPWKASIV
ncbi:hypothetical protein PaG_02086 [Moesziomyces aphidis]|uniref:Uncharacterized protein n=1 Tax=Moesziomyces aphidis TaxID=84754 RepID=W3VQ41_MOEAP|nr:hypothetical protein PaG_02086 [Moesziomyces aphidis]